MRLYSMKAHAAVSSAEYRKSGQLNFTLLGLTAILPLGAGMHFSCAAQGDFPGPPNITSGTRIIDTDAQGKMVVLREGNNNGFTCMPGNPNVVGEPPMCVDEASRQWFADAKAHKPKLTNTVPGITYMLDGATQHSDSDRHDITSKPIEVGPHWMIMWPFDPKTTGPPTTHKTTGAYIMWAGSPYAHMHIVGRP